jgi:hypothetical protein
VNPQPSQSVHRPLHKTEKGSSIILVLVIGLIISGAIAIAYNLTGTNTMRMDRSRDVDVLEAAAEGALEYMYGIWRGKLRESGTAISTTAAQALFTSMPELAPGISYVGTPRITNVDEYGGPVEEPVMTSGYSDQPKGWPAKMYDYYAEVTVQAQPMQGEPVRVTMGRTFRLQHISLTGGIFFADGDFELYRPAPSMVIDGNVHTNRRGQVSTEHTTDPERLRFLRSANVSYVESYGAEVPLGGLDWLMLSHDNDVHSPVYEAGFENQVIQTERVEAIGLGSSAVFDTTDSNPNNDGNRELIEPPVSGHVDPPSIAGARLFHKAGIVIKVTGTINPSGNLSQQNSRFVGGGVEIIPQNGTNLNTNRAKEILGALSLTPALYDKRELENVQVVNVDVSKLAANKALGNLNQFNDVLYIHDTSTTGKRAIRVRNGEVLPSDGLTIATDGGIYLEGDFNTGSGTIPSNQDGNPTGTDATYAKNYEPRPAALVGDAVMILSGKWNDAYASSSLTDGHRKARHTTVNAAIVAGMVPSGWNGYGYSGGMNNFPRFLEDWSGCDFTFRGSLVQLFRSEMFTGEWDLGDIYSPPGRKWSFDSNFLQKTIPGLPSASSTTRGSLVRKY